MITDTVTITDNFVIRARQHQNGRTDSLFPEKFSISGKSSFRIDDKKNLNLNHQVEIFPADSTPRPESIANKHFSFPEVALLQATHNSWKILDQLALSRPISVIVQEESLARPTRTLLPREIAVSATAKV